MNVVPYLPAGLLAVLVLGGLAAAPLHPVGVRTVLVRAAPGAAMPKAATLLGMPAPGYAVLHGDAAAIRAVFGGAVDWQGGPPCSTRP